MSYAQDNGYTPETFDQIMDHVRLSINEEFETTYTPENFVGTQWYKYFYALAQKLIENEVRTSEIFLKLQEYIRLTNERILRPSTSFPGLIDALESAGYQASLKPPALDDAGTVSVAVNVNSLTPEYPAQRLEICTLLKDFVSAGFVFIGTEEEDITLSNGQSFTFKFSLADVKPIAFRATIVISDNNTQAVPDDEEIRFLIFNNFYQRYRMGWDVEPQRYLSRCDVPWASEVLLEYTLDVPPATLIWTDSVYDASFDELFELNLENIEVNIS